MIKKNSLGFTLIELLVTISIIALLASITVVGFAGQTKKARDAKRRADMAAIQTALELYYDKYGEYPDDKNEKYCGDFASRPEGNPDFIPALIQNNFMSKKVRDPKPKSWLSNYEYCTGNKTNDNGKQGYVLWASYETPQPDTSRVWSRDGAICGGTLSYLCK